MRGSDSSWSARRFRFPNGIAVWIACITIVVSLVGPLLSIAASAAASAAQVDRRCQVGEVFDEETGACEAEDQSFPIIQSGQQIPNLQVGPTATATQQVTVPRAPIQVTVPTATTVPSTSEEVEKRPPTEILTPPSSGGGSLELTKYICFAGTDPTLGLSELESICYRADSIEFTLSGGGVNKDKSSTKMTDDNGLATWSDVPDGWTLSESPSDQYADPKVYCGVVGASNPAQQEVEQGAISWPSNGASESVECYWFNFALHVLSVLKYTCPEGADPTLDEAELLNTCTETQGVAFTATHDGQSVTESTGVSGMARWNVPTGPWSLQEDDTSGFAAPRIFCRYFEGEETFQPVAVDGQIEGAFPALGELADGDQAFYQCRWFNFTTEETSSVRIFKYFCPDTVLPSEDAQQLSEQCQDQADPVEFMVSDQQGYTETQTTTGGPPQSTEFTDVPYGVISITETVPDGYDDPLAFCSDNPGDGAGDYEPVEVVSENTINWDLGEDSDGPLSCIFFNLLGQDQDYVAVRKWICPEGTSLGQDLKAYKAACTVPAVGFEFTLETSAGTETKSTEPAGQDSGFLVFTPVVPGEFTLTETMPAGFGDPFWYCDFDDSADPGAEAPPPLAATGDSIIATIYTDSVAIDQSDQYYCQVFNIPSGDGDGENSLTVFKYLCEEEPAGFTSLGKWQDACPAQGDGVKFTLSNADGPQTEQTVNGKADWFDVPEGPFTLSETIPAGYGEPVVWCGWTTLFDGKVADAFPQLVQASGGAFQGSMPQPETNYTCWWFNIPDDDRSVTIHKYTCPASTAIKPGLANYQDACTEPGDGIEFTLQNSDGESTKMVQNGVVAWDGLPEGPFTVTEHVPNGWGEPIWYCEFSNRDNPPDEHHGVAVTASVDAVERQRFTCWVFNFPDFSHQVTAYKWECPHDFALDSDALSDWQTTCATSVVGWEFTLTNADGSSTKATGASGSTSWDGVPNGTTTLSETLPPGTAALAAVFCNLDAASDAGGPVTEDWTRYSVVDSGVSRELDYASFHWTCHFFNQPEGPGEITIHKWLCPPAYDYAAYGADPKVDCTVVTDGIDFTLDQPVGPDQVATTGDAGPGSVSWGNLDAGAYTVTETVPQAIASVFVWDCTGTDIPAVQPTPLNVGNVLNIDVAAGDAIVCNWYNVPPPDDGWITVYKYACWTETFTSEVDCQIYESGASFELFAVDGSISQGVGTTNAAGAYTWNNLDEGAYYLTEISHTPCHFVASEVDSNGNPWVDPLEETIVKVYNCDTDPGGKIPRDYPDTGVAPFGGIVPNLQGTPDASGTPAIGITSGEFYEISCLEEPISVDDADESDAEPTSPPITPVGTPSSGEECVRGAVPAHLTIDAANVDAGIEVVEIVDGVMQAPSGPHVAAWYKDTARLGEANNLVIAGHLNWWNVPEGVFFHLAELEQGDRIEITGEDGLTYIYQVQWTRQEDNSKPPALDVVGPTDQPSLTLITCGGEWDSAVSEYDARTVVRAVQVDVIDDGDVEE